MMQSMQQMWTVLQPNGPNHLQLSQKRTGPSVVTRAGTGSCRRLVAELTALREEMKEDGGPKQGLRSQLALARARAKAEGSAGGEWGGLLEAAVAAVAAGEGLSSVVNCNCQIQRGGKGAFAPAVLELLRCEDETEPSQAGGGGGQAAEGA